MRLWSRAFIFTEYDDKTLEKSGKSKKESVFCQSQRLNAERNFLNWRPIDVEDFDYCTPRLRWVCFVSIDAGMGSDLLNQKSYVTTGWAYRPQKALSRTLTHSAPGRFNQYALYQITPLGFVHQTMDAFVEGIVWSILDAYKSWIQLKNGNFIPTMAILARIHSCSKR